MKKLNNLKCIEFKERSDLVPNHLLPGYNQSSIYCSVHRSDKQANTHCCSEHSQYGRAQCRPSPEDGSVEVVCMCAVDGIQVAGSGQLGSELTPGHLQDLVCDVALNHLDKVLHLVSV